MRRRTWIMILCALVVLTSTALLINAEHRRDSPCKVPGFTPGRMVGLNGVPVKTGTIKINGHCAAYIP